MCTSVSSLDTCIFSTIQHKLKHRVNKQGLELKRLRRTRLRRASSTLPLTSEMSERVLQNTHVGSSFQTLMYVGSSFQTSPKCFPDSAKGT